MQFFFIRLTGLFNVFFILIKTVRRMPIDDVVILDIDQHELHSPFDDMEVFPPEVVSDLRQFF